MNECEFEELQLLLPPLSCGGSIVIQFAFNLSTQWVKALERGQLLLLLLQQWRRQIMYLYQWWSKKFYEKRAMSKMPSYPVHCLWHCTNTFCTYDDEITTLSLSLYMHIRGWDASHTRECWMRESNKMRIRLLVHWLSLSLFLFVERLNDELHIRVQGNYIMYTRVCILNKSPRGRCV